MYVPQLTKFYIHSRSDPRINTSHVSLYMALFENWNQNDFRNPIHITRSEVMAAAKISGIATYHRCMKDLQELGYISYYPSRDSKVPSEVVIR